MSANIVPAEDPRLGHSMEDFAALIPHDNPHQLPIMKVRLSVCNPVFIYTVYTTIYVPQSDHFKNI